MSEAIETKKEIATGLAQASDPKQAERDLLEALLSAAEFKTDEETITEAEIRRNGVKLFSVHLHPLSDGDVRLARKKATVYMPNPQGKKLPPIEKEFNSTKFNSWLVYLATTEEDQEKIWGRRELMRKYSLELPFESVDVLLTVGEKKKLVDTVLQISGMDDDADEDEITLEEYAGE